MASAILDFWTYAFAAMSAQFKGDAPGLRPHFYERPVLKFGPTLVQHPTAVDSRLAEQEHPGEVDVIATLGRHLFVLEVKSTFMRRSQQEACLHASSTLRRAVRQLQRKLAAVSQAVGSDLEFRTSLGLTEPPAPQHQHGWIVDTCIECDHQRFAGFLKVSIEEVLIALSDDRHLLNDLEGLLSGTYDADASAKNTARSSARTLYPEGFSEERFIEVIETEAVWDEIDSGTSA